MRSTLGLFLSVPALACSLPAAGQSIVVAVESGHVAPVQRVVNTEAYASFGGSLRPADHFDLRPAPYFHDGSVRIDSFRLGVRRENFTGKWSGAKQMDFRLRISGEFVASQDLDDCYAVVEFFDAGGARHFAFAQLPRLRAGMNTPVALFLPIPVIPDEHRRRFHLFSGRLECRQSEMGPNYLLMGTTESEDLAATERRDLRPLVAVAPATPEGAGPSEAEAEVACLVSPEGDVAQAELIRASQPQFGRAALEAARQWIFVPAIQNHRHVAERVVLPFHFHPPPAKKTPGF